MAYTHLSIRTKKTISTSA